MIYYLVTDYHRYTIDELARLEPALASSLVVVPYPEALTNWGRADRDPPPVGTYVFSDLERLTPEDLEAASDLRERLRATRPKLPVLNDPARSLRRYDLLRTLHERGVNEFTVHRLADVVPEDALRGSAPRPKGSQRHLRFPVYIREENEHTKNLTPLLHSWEEIREAGARLLSEPRHYRSKYNQPATRWYRMEDLIVVEWCDTSDAHGIFRKYGAFVVGEVIVPRAVMCAGQWMISDYELFDDQYLQESLDYLATNPHADFLLDVAHEAGIEYGRFDYAFLEGRPQIWEINTNPGVLNDPKHGEINLDLHRRPVQRVVHALRALDARPAGRVRRWDDEPAGESSSPGRTQTICLCMIVRNEGALLERCLHAALGLIDTWVICDAGSTDDTREIIHSVLGALPGELYESRWVNFGHNRTVLLERAQGRADYLLVIDADMTIRQQAPMGELDADAYVLRGTGSLDVAVIRLLRGDRRWWYEGATHEYIATNGRFTQAELPEPRIEHQTDGPGQPPHPIRDEGLLKRARDAGFLKLIRDAGVLKQEVARDPSNARSVFYLAQTYRDLGKPELAIDYYRRRAAMGGWDEEVFYSTLQEGMLRAEQGDDASVPVLLEAWQQRPSRAEPLYELARVYRDRGDFAIAHMFAQRGLEIPYPSDVLFIHKWVYDWGLLLERAIAAAGMWRVDDAAADLGRLRELPNLPTHVADYVNERLADLATWPVERSSTDSPGGLARLTSLAPSTRIGEVKLDVEPAWPAFNPSIAGDGEGFRMIVRTANYEAERGGAEEEVVLHTINYLLSLDSHLAVERVEPIVDRAAGPRRYPSQIQGYEDCRLIKVGDGWYATATVGDLNPSGLRQIALLALRGSDVLDVHHLAGLEATREEKNWMPFVLDGSLHLLYSCYPTVVLQCNVEMGSTRCVAQHEAPPEAAGFRGGSQGLEVPDGHLFVVHEVDRSEPVLRYAHRFILLDHDLRLSSISPRFMFTSDRIEFCAGIAQHGDEIILSFGVSDAAAGLAATLRAEVFEMLEPVTDVATQPA